MTPRERLIAATKGEPVDYVPLYGSFNPLSEVQRRGHEWQFPWPPTATTEEQLRYQVEVLGLDELVHFGLDVCAWRETDKRVWHEGEVLHKAYFTDAGELHAAIRYTDSWPHGEDIPFFSDFNIGHFVKPWIETEADLEAYMTLRATAEEAEIERRAEQAVARARGLAEPLGLATCALLGTGLTGAQQLCGATQLCLMTLEQPALVETYLEFEHQQSVRAMQALAGRGVDFVRRNGFYETADFYGPAMLERFLGDRLREECATARAGGMLFTYTAHTGLMPILDYLAGLKLDGYFGPDISHHGVNLRLLVDKLRPSSLWTGPSSTFHIWQGPEPTRQAVRQVFEAVGKTGLVLTQCVSSHSIMPWESTAAMIDEWKRLR